MIGGAFWTPESTVIGGGALNFEKLIAELFANGEQGFVYDPNDLNTMFQDAAGTVPVTDMGQPVGLIQDKSGNGNHAKQTDSSKRPILRKNAATGANYLEFDGFDDRLFTQTIDLSSISKFSFFSSLRKLRDTQSGTLFAFGNQTINGSFVFYAPYASGNTANYTTELKPASAYYREQMGTYTSPTSNVVRSICDYTQANTANAVKNAINGVSIASSNINITPSNTMAVQPFSIGVASNGFIGFYGQVYSLIGLCRTATATEISSVESILAKQVGVTLGV